MDRFNEYLKNPHLLDQGDEENVKRMDRLVNGLPGFDDQHFGLGHLFHQS